MLIFDAHLDLAMNALEWNRDLTRPLADIRAGEAHLRDKPDRGQGTVCLPELRRGGIGLCVATLIARIEHNQYSPVAGWRSQEQAWAMTQGQFAWYRAMEEAGQMTAITDLASLEQHLKLWDEHGRRTPSPEPDRPLTPSLSPALSGGEGGRRPGEGEVHGKGDRPVAPLPIGYVLSLEGADSIVTFDHLERGVAAGLRALGPAHYGPGVYAFGTDSDGPLPARGRELLREMRRLGLILDATHLSDRCFRDALDAFDGPVWASHSNCRVLVPHPRQHDDDQIRELVRRDAVIGAALDGWMMVPGWERGRTTPQSAGLKLEKLVEHIDHVCQLAGNARHAGLGSDLDGAFGREQCPADVDSIADLARLEGMLRARGYGAEDVRGILHGNFIAFLRRAWS